MIYRIFGFLLFNPRDFQVSSSLPKKTSTAVAINKCFLVPRRVHCTGKITEIEAEKRYKYFGILPANDNMRSKT